MRYVDKLTFTELAAEAQQRLNAAAGYNSDTRVRDIIRIVYQGCCAFCGSSPEASSFFQIEHFYPKLKSGKYHQYEKDFFNLHYSCQRCNQLKGHKPHYKILSPNYFLDNGTWKHTQPDKIDKELFYVGHLLYATKQNGRGAATIRLFDLNNHNGRGRSNRAYLVESRIRIFDQVYQLMNLLYEMLNDDSYFHDKIMSSLFCQISVFMTGDSPYANMIIQNFGEGLLQLLEVFMIRKTTQSKTSSNLL